jgi:hypothetical protein
VHVDRRGRKEHADGWDGDRTAEAGLAHAQRRFGAGPFDGGPGALGCIVE